MSVASRGMRMAHAEDPRKVILDRLGSSLDGGEVLGARILAARYIRPTKTATGIELPDQTIEEDRYQGKAHLVLAMGPLAFTEDETHHWGGKTAKVGDWIVLRASDGIGILVGDVECRIIEDVLVRMIIPHPDVVF